MNTIDSNTAKLAGFQIDLLQKMRSGHLTFEHLKWFLGLSKTRRDSFIVAPAATIKPAPLKWLSTIVVNASRKFVVKENFTKNDPSVLMDICHSFEVQFLDGDDKAEKDLGLNQALNCHRLTCYLKPKTIIDELGGENEVEVTLSEVFSLIANQGNGEVGILLNNGRPNVFFVRDRLGVLWMIYVFQNGWRGWHISAHSVDQLNPIPASLRVFSRKIFTYLEKLDEV